MEINCLSTKVQTEAQFLIYFGQDWPGLRVARVGSSLRMLHFPLPSREQLDFMFCIIILDLSGINQLAAESSPLRERASARTHGAVAFRLRVRLSSDFFLCPRIDGARDIRKDERKDGRSGAPTKRTGWPDLERRITCNGGLLFQHFDEILQFGHLATLQSTARRWRCA